jgi:hypothetical protein
MFADAKLEKKEMEKEGKRRRRRKKEREQQYENCAGYAIFSLSCHSMILVGKDKSNDVGCQY